MKNKIQRLIRAAKEYKKLYDDDELQISAIQTRQGKPAVLVYKPSELFAAFPGFDVKKEDRNDEDYPFAYSVEVDGVLFYAIGHDNE